MFYDSLLDLESLREQLPADNTPQSREVRRRAFSILYNSIIALIFERLPKEYREEFADRFAADAEDPTLTDYLIQRIGVGIQNDIRTEFYSVMEKLAPVLAKARMWEEPW